MGHESCGYCNTVPCECPPYRVEDNALREKDKDRFTAEQKASALTAVQAYMKAHPNPVNPAQIDSVLVVGNVIPASGHPRPHAARDTTEEWDMKKKKSIAPNHKREPDVRTPASNPTEAERRDQLEGRFSDDIDRESVEAQNIMAGSGGRGCVQEGFPGPRDEEMPPPGWPDLFSQPPARAGAPRQAL